MRIIFHPHHLPFHDLLPPLLVCSLKGFALCRRPLEQVGVPLYIGVPYIGAPRRRCPLDPPNMPRNLVVLLLFLTVVVSVVFKSFSCMVIASMFAMIFLISSDCSVSMKPITLLLILFLMNVRI